MKHTSLMNRSLFAVLLLSASVSVFAGVPATTQPADAVAATGSLGKTRAQVHAELIQAEQAGLVPAGSTRYPAGPSLIARNAYNFQQARNWWETHGQRAAWGG